MPLVVVAMSGGVDSSVAAALLKQQGYDLIGVTLNVWPEQSLVEADTRRNACCSLDAVDGARRVADLLEVPHYTLNFREVFDRTVIQDFVSEYTAGRTPNPCVRCNRFVKFEALMEKARSLGADYLATGHYARVGRSPDGRYTLSRGVDPSKDQSYALYSLTQEQLAHTLFPLGGQTKRETRRIAEEMGLATADRPESQEICFVQDNDYAGFLRSRDPSVARTGPIRDRGGRILGTHLGIAFYTIGQRRGLGIAGRKPLYVEQIIPEENAVVVGEGEGLYSRRLVAGDLNWVSVRESTGPLRVAAKIRYRAAEVPATARLGKDGGLVVEFDEPQRAVTPGQAVVLYQGDDVVVGGTIMARNTMDELHGKYEKLKKIIRSMESVAVAYSGGVDSTFLLKVAVDELGRDRVLGVIAISESYPARELEEAKQLAEEMGARIQLIHTEELSNPDFAANPTDRCAHCKTELFTKMFPIAKEQGLKELLYGVNFDDLGDFRPGIAAAKRMGARGPLQEAEMTKDDIRQLSRELGLRTWDKPAYACLSSRIPYGQRITREALLQVDAAENFIRDLGFRQVRVRHHDKIARIELPPEQMAQLFAGGFAGQIVAKLKELGYLYVTLDLQGYRMGSLNEALKIHVKR